MRIAACKREELLKRSGGEVEQHLVVVEAETSDLSGVHWMVAFSHGLLRAGFQQRS